MTVEKSGCVLFVNCNVALGQTSHHSKGLKKIPRDRGRRSLMPASPSGSTLNHFFLFSRTCFYVDYSLGVSICFNEIFH